MGMFQATAATSAAVRPGQCGSCCQDGLATYAEQPLPEAPNGLCHTVSVQPRGLLARDSWGPPAAVTVARLAGKLAAGNPEPPEEAPVTCPRWSYSGAYASVKPPSPAPELL